MRRFVLNIDKLAVLLLPMCLRRPLLYAFLKAFGAPLRSLYEAFMRRRQNTLFSLKYDSGKYNIERYLNIAFSDGGDAIYITNDGSGTAAYLPQFIPFFIDDPNFYGEVHHSHLPQSMPFFIDTVTKREDFVVHIPASLSGRTEEIRRAVESLALPSYTFRIVEYN